MTRNRLAGKAYVCETSRPLPPISEASSHAVSRADDEAGADWRSFVQGAPNAELYHDFRWRTLIENVFGHECYYLVARQAGGRVSGVLPLVRIKSRLFGDFLVSVPYMNYGGVLAESVYARDALLHEAARCARDLGVEHIELRHRDGPDIGWPTREDKITMLRALPDSKEELWRSFKPKLRSQIRRPEKDGATVRQGGADLLDDFYAVFAHNMRDLGTPVYPKRFFAAILKVFSEQAKLFVIDLGGKPAAVGFVMSHRDTVEIPWASSLRKANSAGVNMLLYWSALADTIERGLQRFDFGRCSVGSGTYRFKQQWGAEPQQLRWHYWLAEGTALPALTPSNPKYQAAIALWRRLPVPLANLLGPGIVKNLP